MVFGSGEYRYEVEVGWGQLPDGWKWGWIAAVACDSNDRVFVYSRSEHPLVVFDRDGRFLASWGEDILEHAHGITIDGDDNVYCTEHGSHCVYKLDRHGKLVMTLGTPGQAAARDGDPFRQPTDVAVAPGGEIYVSDGYGNARVHKYSPDGELLLSWGEHGSGSGQLDTSHCVRVARDGRIWVCDRANNRLQIFDGDGHVLGEQTGFLLPNALCFDPSDDVLYVSELDHRVSICTLDGERIAEWGGAVESNTPGEFLGGPHGIWVDSHGDLYVSEVLVDGRLQKYIRQ